MAWSLPILAVPLLVLASLATSLLADPAGVAGAEALRPLLDVDRNGLVPVGFLVLCLAGAAVAAWHRGNALDLPERRNWRAVAALLLLAALEKALGIHEAAGILAADRWGSLRGGLLAAYLLPAALLLAGLAWAGLDFVRSLDPGLRRRLAVALAVLVGCGLGLEVVQAAWIRLVSDHGVALVLMAHGEEGGEMLGAALLLRAVGRRDGPG